jgi:hypothetical protein
VSEPVKQSWRITQVKGVPIYELAGNDKRWEMAMDLRTEYGLHHIEIARVMNNWVRHSQLLGENWSRPTHYEVEKVFNVKLEEL